MIEFISGRLVSYDKSSIVIEQRGIGYSIYVPISDIAQFQHQATMNETVHVYTELIVREDSLSLYGFFTPAERSMFRLLLGVSRVGPQLACSILSHASIDQIAVSILEEKESILTAVPGIGQKNAKRIILELKDKMKKYYNDHDQEKNVSPGREIYSDATLALVALGFEKREAEHAIQEVNRRYATETQTPKEASDLIKDALVILRGDGM
ncbi:MAG: Holliday junction branch migration protein RuvA [Methanomicrobiales archaeon]|jgi:Holliday junction DNA helicase RuvA|nr:Holliday junction branch migration protein RuvA [Methanomicrobiales archaeon]